MPALISAATVIILNITCGNTMKIGDKVHYQPEHYDSNDYENGIVKSFPSNTDLSVFVVYHCNEEWESFLNYTGALTLKKDLKPGWKTNE